MIFYITVLRCLAAMLITNAHYTGVYPTDLIANGGLLGDVIFFCVSGYCLYNIKQKFGFWYLKRIIRIYPTLWIITILYLLIGFYNFSEEFNLFYYLVYPTYYHFVASIIILYILYYIIIKNKYLKEKIPIIMILLFIIQMIVYLFFYDKSYYHIDKVREPMIRFLFLQSMLLGALFRKNNNKFQNKNKASNWIMLFICIMLYFATKLAFSKIGMISNLQIINQVILFITLYYVMKCFAGIDKKLENLPNKIKKTISFIAEITLEIYLVQYPIIPIFKDIIFPLNWVIITFVILASAFILHKVAQYIIKWLNQIISNLEVKYGNSSNRSI